MGVQILNCSFENNGTGIDAPADANLTVEGTSFTGNRVAIRLRFPYPQDMLERFAQAMEGLSEERDGERRVRRAAEASGIWAWAQEHSLDLASIVIDLVSLSQAFGWI